MGNKIEELEQRIAVLEHRVRHLWAGFLLSLPPAESAQIEERVRREREAIHGH
jgi:hypothetical protein